MIFEKGEATIVLKKIIEDLYFSKIVVADLTLTFLVENPEELIS